MIILRLNVLHVQKTCKHVSNNLLLSPFSVVLIHQSKLPSKPRIHYSNNIRSSSSTKSWNWASSFKSLPSSISSETTYANPSTDKTNKDNMTSSQSILAECSKLHSSIMPLNEKLRGPLARHSDQRTNLPFVLLVGNHSSGKSSFINHMFGRNVQTAGVAPTDDCFTVISPGTHDWDRDGPALVSDPDMGFGGLRQFGPTLIHHTQLKVRSSTKIHDFMMIDSPGMIDSPVSRAGMVMMNTIGSSSSSSSASAAMSAPIMDRGYDFAGVVRWLADRADVVLLFFDPDKPGTTGETLNVLLHSLGGMDHKLLIVLNKADQFKKIHDFARAYGSLCWNLSKVIPRKDLPRIFTMCIPMASSTTSSSSIASSGSATPTSALPVAPDNTERIGLGLTDLHQTREEVVAEVMKAPQRRVDNVITHLHDSLHLLLMHALVAEDTRKKYARFQRENKMQEIGSLLTGLGMSGFGLYWNLPYEFTGGILVATALGVGMLSWFNARRLVEMEHQLVTPEEISASFQRTHAREIRDADEFTASVWQRVRDQLRMTVMSVGLRHFPAVGANDINGLKRILDEEIPRLRRLASPSK